MAGFRNAREVADAQDAGRYLYRSFRKQATQTTGSGIWFDLSMSPGNPVPNYYIGAAGAFTPLKRSTDGGIDHGPSVGQFGQKKFLRKLMALTPTATAAPLTLVLMDYIGFYGFIDESITDEQSLDNTLAPTRYAGGRGVQLMPVVVAGQSGGQTFTVTYTNQDGVTGRVTRPVKMTTQAVNGTILHSLSAGDQQGGPFLPLQSGDSGVRSVQSVLVGGVGDVGLFALVMVKPLATLDIRGIDAPTEIDYLTDCGCSLPEIQDDAYLNFVSLPVGTLAAAPIHGVIETTWN
jgi:hypothetical protein